jgi:hypothetical protein
MAEGETTQQQMIDDDDNSGNNDNTTIKQCTVVGRLYSVQYKGIFGTHDEGQTLYM